MDCSESSLCLQPVPLLGVKAAACLAQPKKPWKSLWRRDAIWNLHCSLPRTCLVGWTEERDQSPCPKRLQHKETSQIRGKTSQGSQSWCDRSLCFVSFPFSLSFPSSAWRGELKLLKLLLLLQQQSDLGRDCQDGMGGERAMMVRRKEKENPYEQEPEDFTKLLQSSGRALPDSRLNKKLNIWLIKSSEQFRLSFWLQ